MHQDIVLAQRAVPPSIPIPTSSPTLVCVTKELATARQMANGLALRCYGQLDGEAMYDLSAIEGLIAGALKKLEAAGMCCG